MEQSGRILTEKVWKYLIRLVYDVVTLGAAITFFKAPCNTLIAEMQNNTLQFQFYHFLLTNQQVQKECVVVKNWHGIPYDNHSLFFLKSVQHEPI